jgi:hypothetical protein
MANMKREPKNYSNEFKNAVALAIVDFHAQGVRAPRGFWKLLFTKAGLTPDYTTVAVIRKKVLNNIKLGEQVNEYLEGGKNEENNSK